MPESRWKTALWNLLETIPLRRLTARIALSAGLVGLATQSTAGIGGEPRVPMAPVLTPDATVRKFKGKYVLKRSANSFFVYLAGHRSHSSHSSHSSHRSHSSSSHYSGAHASHYSSSAPPRSAPAAPEPASPPPRKVIEPPPLPPKKSEPLLSEEFAAGERIETRWAVGVLATPPDTFDRNAVVEQVNSALSVTPAARQDGAHFSGYVSQQSFDLKTSSIAVEIRRPASGSVTVFAAAIDASNWIGFRIEGNQLSIESRTKGRVASKKVEYSAAQHRFLRLRTSKVTPIAPVAVWETSVDGRNWFPHYVETAGIQLTALRIALSAGTTKSAAVTGAAVFDHVTVERLP